MAWPKLSAMKSRNGRRARTTLLMLPAHITTHVVMMIAAKNGVVKIAIDVMTIVNAGRIID